MVINININNVMYFLNFIHTCLEKNVAVKTGEKTLKNTFDN